MIGRRDLIAALGSAAAGAVLPSLATAQGRKRPVVGFLGGASPSTAAQTIAAFVDGLREQGFEDGRTVDLVYRFAEGRMERMPTLATEMAELKPDVVLAFTVAPAKQAMPETPIVCPVLVDPIRSGQIASYARPGGWVTGILTIIDGLPSKQIEIATAIMPDARRLGLLENIVTGIAEMERAQNAEIEAAAAKLGIELVAGEARVPGDLEPAFRKLAAAGVAAVIVNQDSMLFAERERIVRLADQFHLPAVYGYREYVALGGLVGYGVNVLASLHRSASFVARILKGAKPSDLPVEFPTKVELVLNLKTAKALGLTIPPTLLARADEVIE